MLRPKNMICNQYIFYINDIKLYNNNRKLIFILYKLKIQKLEAYWKKITDIKENMIKYKYLWK